MGSTVDGQVSRRDLIRMAALSVGAAGLSALAPHRAAAQPRPAPASAELTPAEALARLYEGNQRFATGQPAAPHRTLDRVRAVASKQAPYAALLACADSRVPVEIIFDQGFGDLFVTRVAGNVVDPSVLGSLEFGTAVLGAKVLYVLGHTSCGAVSAAMAGDAVPGQISTLFQHIVPGIKGAHGDVNAAVVANVRVQAELLAEASPVLKRLIGDGQLQVAAGIYDLASGVVTPVPLGAGA